MTMSTHALRHRTARQSRLRRDRKIQRLRWCRFGPCGRPVDHLPLRSDRAAFTLAEMIIASAITGLLALVLAGMTMAIQAAWVHTRDVTGTTAAADAALQRIRWMVAQTGVYRDADGLPKVGLRVLSESWGPHEFPEILVVWSGGRDGHLHGGVFADRQPRFDELIVYAPNPEDPGLLCEFAFPEVAGHVDIYDRKFSQQLRRMLVSPQAEAIALCRNVRLCAVRETAMGKKKPYPAVRFELRWTPTDDQLQGVVPGSPEWFALPWAQSVVTADAGLRQGTLAIELQLEPTGQASSPVPERTRAIPFFHSIRYRYVHSMH
ncbi:MAG: hypothetical protein D6725_17725 [Planctomycetota bacterium]|nr:MAG: hypothetical protein D6725_17725 [Planctomycetota bacterium]